MVLMHYSTAVRRSRDCIRCVSFCHITTISLGPFQKNFWVSAHWFLPFGFAAYYAKLIFQKPNPWKSAQTKRNPPTRPQLSLLSAATTDFSSKRTKREPKGYLFVNLKKASQKGN